MNLNASEIFHPRILESCIKLYENLFFQQAALESMKQVEMALREKGIAPSTYFGDRLVRWLLGTGEHIALSVPLGDEYQDKALLLFRGAFGYYRNYAAHDGSNIDKKICFRVMVIASELLDLVDASSRSFEGIGGIKGLIGSGMFKNEKEFKSLLDFLNSQQFIENDYSDYEFGLLARGFNKEQVDAMFDFNFIKIEEWDTLIEPNFGIFDSVHIEEMRLTEEGKSVSDELDKMISK